MSDIDINNNEEPDNNNNEEPENDYRIQEEEFNQESAKNNTWRDNNINKSGADYDKLKKIVKRVFQMYDIDASGNLNQDEFEKLLNDICFALELPKLNQTQLFKILKLMDNDGDGEISYNELIESVGPINDILMSSINLNVDPEAYHNDNPNFIKGLGRQIQLFEKLKK